MAIASAPKKAPVTPVIVMRGRKTTIGVSVDPMQRDRQLLERAGRRLQRAFALVAMQHDVLDDDDLVVDDEADRRGESAERHEVEALTEELHRDERHHHRHRDDEPGHHRRAPVAEEEPDDESRQDEADDDRVANAADRRHDDVGLVVEQIELDPGRKRSA